MSEVYIRPSEETLEKWKKNFGLMALNVKGYQCWIRFPSVDILRKVMAKIYDTNEDFEKEMLRRCWLAGNRIVLETEELMDNLRFQAIGIMQSKAESIAREGKQFRIAIEGKEVMLKNPGIFDLIHSGKMKKPFESDEYLLKRIWVSGDKSVLNHEWQYLQLLSAVGRIRNKKVTN